MATALPRFCDLLEGHGLKGTAFVVGETLFDAGARRAVRAAAKAGHEIANHTRSHPYDLAKRVASEIQAEVEGGAAALQKLLRKRPAGFRAPGYNLGAGVLPAAIAAGARYDSSILPSPLYQGLKASVMGLLSLTGKKSGASLGDFRESLAPGRPYRPDPAKPYLEGTGPLLELPISSVLGAPLTGALIALAGPPLAGRIAALCARRGFVNLELHGIDLMDIEADALDPALGSVQRDLHIPWQRKAQAFSAFFERMLRTHRAMTLEEAFEFFGQ